MNDHDTIGPMMAQIGSDARAAASVLATASADAKTKASGHPFLSEGNGNFSIDVFEMMPVPGQ